MSDKRQAEQAGGGINIADIYYILFRRKWIILAFFGLGILAAGALFIVKPAQYESEAEVYVQYVASARPQSQNTGEARLLTDEAGHGLLLTELQILSSQDTAREVVSNVTAARILAPWHGGDNTNWAVSKVIGNLIKEETPKTPSILHIAFQHPDQDVCREVLQELIHAYIIKSADLHKSVTLSPDYLETETARLRAKLGETDTALRKAKQDAGIISTIEETRKGWNDEIQNINNQLLTVETQLSERSALMPETTVTTTTTNGTVAVTNVEAAKPVPSEVVNDYKSTRDAKSQLLNRLVAAKLTFAAQSPYVQDLRKQLDDLDTELRTMETNYPSLSLGDVAPAGPITTTTSGGPPVDTQTPSKVLNARKTFLLGRLAAVQQDLKNLEAQETQIGDLQLTKNVQESQLRQFTDNKLQLAGDLNQSGGIKINESPTVAVKKHSKSFKKLLLVALAGSIAGGLALAFVIEMVIDPTIRRPNEVEAKLKLPLFITIPDLSQNGKGNGHNRKALPAPSRALLKDVNGEALVPSRNGGADANGVEPWDRRNGLHRFYAGLRDRLIVNFEVRNLNHNPKLVAVTSCGKGAGVSSIAAGLAASLSETGDGNVLLVDMHADQGAAQHFYQGKPACGLEDALQSETRNNAFVHDNLYVASEGSEGGNLPRILPKRFAGLMPKFKASDFDYIIFDMPAVSQTSVTPRLAGLMDMVLLVIESEKTNRESVQRATALLAESKANVSTVLNKVKTYVPTRLHKEFYNED